MKIFLLKYSEFVLQIQRAPCSNNDFSTLFFYVSVPIGPAEIQPVFPPQGGEKQPDDPMKFFLDALLEFMVTQVNIYLRLMSIDKS